MKWSDRWPLRYQYLNKLTGQVSMRLETLMDKYVPDEDGRKGT